MPLTYLFWLLVFMNYSPFIYLLFWGLWVVEDFWGVTDVSESSHFPLFETHYLTLFLQSLQAQVATQFSFPNIKTKKNHGKYWHTYIYVKNITQNHYILGGCQCDHSRITQRWVKSWIPTIQSISQEHSCLRRKVGQMEHVSNVYLLGAKSKGTL